MKTFILERLKKIDKRFFALFSLALILNVLTWILLVDFPRGGQVFILHYRAQHGVDLLGSKRSLLIVPAIGSFILLLNAVLSFIVSRKDRVLPWAISALTIALEFFFLLALFFLFKVNKP